MDFKFKKSNLNFRVYTSETEPTETGQENDIVIITSVPMSNWILSPDKPSGTPRTDGDVWIRYGFTGNTFNILKNDSMMIATISAYQFVDGTWADVEAKSYQNGKWVAWWSGELLTPNKTWDDITGGWVGDGKMPVYTDDNFTYVGPVVTHTTDAIHFKNSVSRCTGSYHTVNKVDISKFSQIVIEVKSLTCTNGYFTLYIDDDLSGKVKQDAVAFADVIKGGANTNYTGSAFIDVSTKTGEFYIGIAYQCYSGTFDADVEIIFMK